MRAIQSKHSKSALILSTAMAMATAMQPMEPLVIHNPHKDLLPFNLPPKSRLGGYSEGRELTGKQRRARAATKRQRKARQRQAKNR